MIFGWRYLAFQTVFLGYFLSLAVRLFSLPWGGAEINLAFFCLNFSVVLICFQRVLLDSARLALEQGKGASYVAGLWGIKPYPAEKLINSAKRFGLKWCRNAVIRCGQTDLAMKSTGQDGQELLTSLLLELSMPAR